MSYYDNYIERLSKQVKLKFSEIEAIFNFEFGDELEVALCQILSNILPDKFGVCRGFLVSKNGARAGDDIIIYDRLNFPLIRQNSLNDFSLKQQVPIEAVYAYIECKNTINTREVLDKSIDQISKVKKLLFERDLKLNPSYSIEGEVYNGKVRKDWPRQEPEYLNQPFALIFTKSWNNSLDIKIPISKYAPDIIILGEDHIATQSQNLGPDGIKSTLFFDYNSYFSLSSEKINSTSYGIGLVILLQILNKIQLQPINWIEILNFELTPFKD